MDQTAHYIMYNGKNEKYDAKIKAIESFAEIINNSTTITAPTHIDNLLQSTITNYYKETSPVLVVNLLDLITLYLNKFDFKEIPVDLLVKYMVYNQSARVKSKERCDMIFKKLYLLTPNELLSSLLSIITANKLIFVLHAYEIVNYLITLKQFGSIPKRFQNFAKDSFPFLFYILYKSNNAPLKKGTLDVLINLSREMGVNLNSICFTKMDLIKLDILRHNIEKHMSIKIPVQGREDQEEKVQQILPVPKILNLVEQTNNVTLCTPDISPYGSCNTSFTSSPKILKSNNRTEEYINAKAKELATDCLKSIEKINTPNDEIKITSLKNIHIKQKQLLENRQQKCSFSINNSTQQNEDITIRITKQLQERRQKFLQQQQQKQIISTKVETQKVIDYNTFATLGYKEKFLLIDGLYKGITEGTVKLGDSPVSPSTLLEFFKFANTKGLSQSIKILKIYLMFQESKLESLKTQLQPFILQILKASIKNCSMSQVLLYQIISLIQTIHELKVFNNEVLQAFLFSLCAKQNKTQINALEILSNYIMRNQIPSDPLFHQILQQSAILASSSASSKTRSLALQILIQAQQLIGDQINSYLGPLRFCQLRSFKKATMPIDDSSKELSIKEKMKFCEIESLVCQNQIKNQDQLIQLIQHEIDFYNKNQSSEHSLSYVKIFSALFSRQNKNVVINTLILLGETYQKFKPSEIIHLFDVVMQVRLVQDVDVQRIILCRMIQYHGVALFYSKITEYLTQKKYAKNLLTILRHLINEISQPMLSEIIEYVLLFIDEDQIELNNMIYHFLALSCIQRSEQYIERIIHDKYFFADHLLKKVQREKEKCLYLIHLAQKNKQNQSNTVTSTQDLLNFDAQSLQNQDFNKNNVNNISSFESQNQIFGTDKVLSYNEEDNYSFIQGEEDEI